MNPLSLWAFVIILLVFPNIGEPHKHRNTRVHSESGHGGGATFHHASHHEGGKHHEVNEELEGESVGDESTEVRINQTAEIDPKFISIGVLETGNMGSRPDKLLVFNDDRYEPWSNWSSCILKDCIEVRFRKCKDETWTNRSPNKIHTSNCLSKYYAEKRTCLNKTACNSHVIPEKLSENCGIRPKSSEYFAKIIGGKESAPHSWPWAVRLSVKPPRSKPVSFCAGTLIAPQWVLTAAHCLLVENKRMPVGQMVRLKEHMKSTIYVHFGDHDKTKRESAQQDIRVEKAILHPRYHRKLMADGDDIALIYLTKPVKLSPEVGYACLPNKDIQLEPGAMCYAVGWGSSEPGRTPTFDDINSIFDSLFLPDLVASPFFSRPFSFSPFFKKSRQPAKTSDELREVELPVMSIKECRKYYPDLNDEVHICAGAKGKDTCAGDSGGGLYCKLPQSNRWFTGGVTSFGLARGCGTNPGVYTSVLGHLDWITQIMASSVY